LDEWVTTTDACQISGYSEQYLRRLLRAEKINAHKFGTIWQVDKESLLAYLSAADDSTDKRHGSRER